MNAANRPPAPSFPMDAAARAIQRRAAEWLALGKARRLTPAEQTELAAWRAADVRHDALFREVEAADQTFDRLAFYPRDRQAPVDPDLLGRAGRRAFRPALVGLAAALALAGFVAVRDARQRPGTAAPPPPLVAHCLRLPDGSVVELNADSQVAPHFTAAERRIRLVRGEAHFTVAKNPARPFIVEAGAVSVRAVGTAFDVRLRPATVAVLVTEGKVGVTTDGDAPWPASAANPHRSGATPPGLGAGLILVAGERTEVHLAPPAGTARPLVVKTLTPAQIDQALAWQPSRLAFDALPLSDVVTRFNRSAAAQDGAAAVHLSIADPRLAAVRFSGRIRSDRVENFVDVLESDFGVTAERRGTEIILRRTR